MPNNEEIREESIGKTENLDIEGPRMEETEEKLIKDPEVIVPEDAQEVERENCEIVDAESVISNESENETTLPNNSTENKDDITKDIISKQDEVALTNSIIEDETTITIDLEKGQEESKEDEIIEEAVSEQKNSFDKIFALSHIGANHIRDGKVCQDSTKSYCDKNMAIICVADGHGSDNYPRTDRGSRYACEAGIEVLKAFANSLIESSEPFDITDKHNLSNITRNMYARILSEWNERVEKDENLNPLFPSDWKERGELAKVSPKYIERYKDPSNKYKAYGTTLIGALVMKDLYLAIQIGDGKCVMIDENLDITFPIPEDENCQMNVTTSICDNDAIDEFRYVISNEIPLGIFVGCDGIDDSYAGDDDLKSLYLALLGDCAEKGIDNLMTEVRELLPELSKKGSGDDVSIAGIIRSDVDMKIYDKIRNKAKINKLKTQIIESKQSYNLCIEKIKYLEDASKKAEENYIKAKNTWDSSKNKLKQAKDELKKIATAKQKLLVEFNELKKKWQ